MIVGAESWPQNSRSKGKEHVQDVLHMFTQWHNHTSISEHLQGKGVFGEETELRSFIIAE